MSRGRTTERRARRLRARIPSLELLRSDVPGRPRAARPGPRRAETSARGRGRRRASTPLEADRAALDRLAGRARTTRAPSRSRRRFRYADLEDLLRRRRARAPSCSTASRTRATWGRSCARARAAGVGGGGPAARSQRRRSPRWWSAPRPGLLFGLRDRPRPEPRAGDGGAQGRRLLAGRPGAAGRAGAVFELDPAEPARPGRRRGGERAAPAGAADLRLRGSHPDGARGRVAERLGGDRGRALRAPAASRQRS